MLLQATPLRALKRESPVDFEQVKEFIRTALAEHEATSVAVAVAHRGQIIWQEGFGFADLENKVVSTSHTPYCLASITKTFTAALVAELADGKRFSLDDAVLHHLEASSLRGPNGDPQAVTIRMLGAHCSGLPGTFSANVVSGATPEEPFSTFLDGYGCLAYPPGQIYEYGNIGFEVLGAVVQNVTGRAFGPTLEQRVLKPLGMRDSFFSSSVQRISSAAIGYDGAGKRIPLYRTSTPPSGELYASVHDMGLYALFQLGQADSAHAPIERVIRESREPVFKGPNDVDSTFGWFRRRLDSGEDCIFKGGGQPGIATKIVLLPSAELGCVVLTNRSDNTPFAEECCQRIIRNYVPTFVMPREDISPNSFTFQPLPDVIGKWVGKLVNGGANQLVSFTMAPDGKATFALSNRAAELVKDIRDQKPGFEGDTSGLVDCRDALAFGKRTLGLKLIPHEGKLIGRVTARGNRPGLLTADIPYVLTLERA
jgi:CubicO group peptidase (beta-lactamase class C family)